MMHDKEEDERSEEDERTEEDESESENSETSDSEREDAPSEVPELEDNATYREWHKRARHATRDMRAQKFEKYVSEGMDEDQAEEKANMKTMWAVKRHFFDSYGAFLSRNHHLTDDVTHQEIVADIEEKTEKGIDVHKALNILLAKHRSKFSGLFQQDEDEDDEEMESDD